MTPFPSPSSARRTLTGLAGSVLALGLLVGCGDDDPRDIEDVDATSGQSSASDPTDASASTDPTATPSADVAVLPVYYAGETPQGDRLYREFVQSSGTDPLVAVAAAVTSGDPVDPDYRTLWPNGRLASVTQAEKSIVVEIPDEGWLEAGALTEEEAELAVQQLVYSLQGAIGERLPVTVEYDGKPAATLLGIDAAGGLKAAPQLDVLALVNVTEPAEGTVVTDTFTATGRASSFEATVPWTIEDSTGTMVLEGFTTAEGWMDKLYPWTAEIDVSSLDSGSYTFIARTDDPSDGEGGGPTEDTKRITVQ